MAKDDRLLNPSGRRHYRRRYSLTETRLGALIMAGLGSVAAWIGFKGAHPDPSLFANTPDLLDPGQKTIDRGPIPDGLAADGWKEGKLATFDNDTLYEKINGRAGYFQSRGFKQLWFIAMLSKADPSDTIDLEIYDLDATDNARGAYVGEKAEGIASTESSGGVWHIDRNALYLARGKYYVRAIGSRESPGVLSALGALRERLEKALAGGERPWGHHVLVDGMGVVADQVGYAKENAMSFDFARNVYSAVTDGDVEVFVTAAPDAAAADKLAERLIEGFVSYGKREESADGVWVVDQYLSAFSTARSSGPLVFGVRGAADRKAGVAALAALQKAVAGLDEAVVKRAVASSDQASSEEAPKDDAPPEVSAAPDASAAPTREASAAPRDEAPAGESHDGEGYAPKPYDPESER
ncbi:MAG: DUF6599 family protein [Polyangiaceae bacterium]